MKFILLFAIVLFARGSTFAQADSVFIDVGNGTTPKMYLTSQIDSITFFRWAGTGVGINDQKIQNIPAEFAISQNYPNPFNPTTRLQCQIPANGKVDVRIYDINGRLIKEIFSGEKEQGQHTFIWDGKNRNGVQVASGTYLFNVRFNYSQLTKKIIFLK